METDINTLVLESLMSHNIFLDSILIHEGSYWETPNVDIKMGYLLFENLSQHCLVVDNINWFSDIKPSFYFIVPDLKKINESGSKCKIQVLLNETKDVFINDIGHTNISTRWSGKPINYNSWINNILSENIILSNFQLMDKSKPISLLSNSSLIISNIHPISSNLFEGEICKK